VMVAHAVFPGLDPERRPASLSRPIASLLLRGRLGFSGLTVADDLEMRALEPWGELPERSEAALLAGCDLLPVCHTLEAVPEILDRLERPGLAGRLAEARDRLSGYRQALREHSPPERPDLATVRARLEEVRADAQTA
ncbi:MAG TPA: glycoside hydrolase family 3 N-terminal domain-containing protein, partial [Thermoanaerobaculia bacterium]|nr:glycoside hydrolase family 3 N-terminal domain-containing protein [Thermoanaerobaculia bacterium]